MDPIADKLLVIAALLALVSLDRLAAWVAMVIIARELAVTVARAQAPRGHPGGGLGQGQDRRAGRGDLLPDPLRPDAAWVDALVYVGGRRDGHQRRGLLPQPAAQLSAPAASSHSRIEV